jgi:phosphatidylglycerol:prolipoprotein diacylglycerol transferase
MHPHLFDLAIPGLGPLRASSYFVFLVVGCVVGIEVALREARRTGEPPRTVLAISGAAVVGGLVGGRLLHILAVDPGAYLADPAKLLRFWEGGLVFYGAALGGFAGVALGARRSGLSLLRLGDLYAAPLMIGLAFGRIGCLSAGCCYGRPIDWGTGVEWPWGITFLSGSVPSWLRGFPLHPTQVYASINAVLLFLLLSWLRRRQRFEGQVLATVVIAYGLTRSVLEFFRLDLNRGFLFEGAIGQTLSTSQGVSAALVLLALAFVALGPKRPVPRPLSASTAP